MSYKKLNNDIPFYINVFNDWIYYSNTSDNFSIYKVKTDGTGRTKLNSHKSEFINVVGNWIYYSESYGLYKVKKNGTSKTFISTDISNEISVIGDWIYFKSNADDKYYRIKTNGTSREKL